MSESKVSAIIGQFNGELEDAKTYRTSYENMWLDNYRAFYNVYKSSVKNNFADNASQLYVGVTRQKCIGAWQRACDILFGKKELPWTIKATPKPNITNKRAIQKLIQEMPPQIKATVKQQPQLFYSKINDKLLKKVKIRIAEKACKAMSTEIADLWIEDHASIKFKHAILEATITGSGIIKVGTTEKSTVRWQTDADNKFNYNPSKDYLPTVKYVSIFDVWFDPSAKLVIDDGLIGSCDFTYERHTLSKAELLELIKLPYFNEEAIRNLIRNGPNHIELSYESDRRSILDQTTTSANTKYDLWERWGILDVSTLRESGIEPGEQYDDTDIVHANTWFSGNDVIRFVINPNKPAQLPYQLVPYEISPGELYGFGIPYKMADSQDLLNATTRLFIDNKVDAAGPVFFVNEDRWTLDESPSTAISPWSTIPLSVNPNEKISDIIDMKVIPDVSNSLIPLLEYAKNMADEESGVPAFAHGAQNPDLIRATGGTASGMSMVLNIYDLGIKTVVRNIDDFLIGPTITKLYNWFMQYSDDDEIKGDMKVIANGTIGLMAKEVKSQRLTQLLAQTANPVDIQSFNRGQLWLDTLEAIDLDPERYRLSGQQQQQMAPPAQPVQNAGGPGPSRPAPAGPQVGTRPPVSVGR